MITFAKNLYKWICPVCGHENLIDLEVYNTCIAVQCEDCEVIYWRKDSE